MKWWQDAVFYQIYPRSFADGNGDGIGDFPGMTAKLDYLASLGVGAVWISPHYPSPLKDCGYDVTDYSGVAPEYGTLDDFKVFLKEAHARGIRVVLDLVLNHSSDLHLWFVESASSRDNPKADWFVWRDPAPDGGPPNDWQSFFDGSAWTWVEARKQYYYHIFMKEQPDLNWSNPEVRAAIYDAVRFWLGLGVDGFRLDAVGTIFEDPALSPQGTGHNLQSLRMAGHKARTPWAKRRAGKLWQRMYRHQFGKEGVHEVMRELRAVVDEFPGDRVLIAEDDNVLYLGSGEDELHMVFNFPLMKGRRLDPATVLENQRERLASHAALPKPGWPCNTMGNHDSSRILGRFAKAGQEEPMARIMAALMLTLRGTPVLYNGEELGMRDHHIDDVGALRDTVAVWHYESLVKEFGISEDEAAAIVSRESRDKCRTPQQWGPGPNADFCPAGVQPWLPVNPDYAEGVNAAEEDGSPGSFLEFYRALGRLRKEIPALREGDWTPFGKQHKKVLSYLRTLGVTRILVAMNFSERPRRLKLAEGTTGSILFLEGELGDPRGQADDSLPPTPVLGPWAILVAELD